MFETLPRQMAAPGLPPAYYAACVALIVAVAALAANPSRPASRMWALALASQGFWLGLIGAMESGVHHELLLRLEGCCEFGSVATIVLLFEAIRTPWASLRYALLRVRWWLLAVAAVSVLPFCRYYLIPTLPHPAQGRGAIYWIMGVVGSGFAIRYAIGAMAHFRRRPGDPRVRWETVGYLIFLSASLALAILYLATHGPGHQQLRREASAAMLPIYAGILIALWKSQVLVTPGLSRTAALLGARITAYGLASGITVLAVGYFAEARMDGVLLFAWLGLALGLSLIPMADSALQNLIGSSVGSPTLLRAQSSASALIRSEADVGALHAGFCRILREWSDGSEEIFLSDGAFTPAWPLQRFTPAILTEIGQSGFVTPETAERLGRHAGPQFDYLTRNRIGAVVCAGEASGERLIAAFQARPRRGPFHERELREVRSLLATMQMGFALARMRQRLRGNERLNFYAQYAPQFAHELRNGLYLQTQLLSAIAAGRVQDIRPEDARLSLEQTEQIDRLCDHFFNAGALFNRPIERIRLRGILETLIPRLRPPGNVTHISPVALYFQAEDATEVFANAELLATALHNLVKNGLEASKNESGAGAVEIHVIRDLDKVHILVQDCGPGLPEDRRLDPFSPGRSEKRHGMGLGLSIVRDCVEAMGGTVAVRHTGETGTCFEVALVCAQRFDGAALPTALLAPVA